MKLKDAAEESARKKNVVFNWLEKWNSLPEDVKVLIINKLSMLEVFRLGNVCKDFSDFWKGLINLDFGKDVMKLIDERGFKFGDITGRIVSESGLKGLVDSFDLYISRADHIQQVERWLKFLSKKHVKSLAIQYAGVFDDPTLSSDILKCTDLHHLSLKGFRLAPFVNFQGFANLISLKLDSITVTHNHLHDVLAKSLLLEKLHLDCWFRDDPLVIDNCMLKTFHLESADWRLCLRGKCSNLTVACFYCDLEISAELPGKNKLNQFFNLMPNIEILTLTGKALITLAGVHAPGRYDRLNAGLQNLKQLDIWYMKIQSFECLACVLCIIRSSPNLQSLSLFTLFGVPEPTKEETEIFYENQGSVEISSSLLEFNMDINAEYSELLMTVIRTKELSLIESIMGYQGPESTVIKFDLAWPDNRHIFNRQAGRFYWNSG